MAEVKDYGELFTADILVVGGSMSGLTTAIRAKENNPELDILVIDKGIIGWNGQSTKAGNGIRSTSKHPDGVMNALGYPKRLGWNPQCKYGRLGRAASSRTHIRAEQKAAISPSGEARVNFLKILVEVSP